ncbi:PP2C family protein-serine/threonine phosphatase [Paenibacillus chungangensis]|uniref:PP2C family protein-serine/threonine phosphatase n=1 Tax=Paenibacillus chungangensis TaxID=696535 RepID=A0ABW3HP63_9BACL
MTSWMPGRPFQLLFRLFFAYMAALLGGTIFIIINNLVFHQLPMNSMLLFHIPFLLASDIIFALVLLVFTWFRLNPLFRNAHATKLAVLKSNLTDPSGKEQLFRRLLRFPYELFVSVVVLAAVFIVLFHTSDIVRHRAALSIPYGWNKLAISISSELGLTFVVGILLFSLSRATLRPYLLQLHLTAVSGFKPSSMQRSLYLICCVCFAITFMASGRFALLAMTEKVIDLPVYGLVAGMYTLFSISVVVLFVRNWQRDLHIITTKLYQLGGDDQTMPFQAVPLFSDDEVASLTIAFNQVQERLSAMYDEVAEQLALARDIQQRLLPAALPVTDPLQLAVYCEPCYEVGGDFYDVIPIDDTKMIMAIGDVAGKGMSAAIVMTAILAGLREEAAKGGSSGQMMSRLNEQLYSIAKGRLFVTVGLAVIRCKEEVVEVDYTSAGHLSPYVVADGIVRELAGSSLPLGVADDCSYTEAERTFLLAKGQTLVMQTDGIVDALDAHNELFGFERWENELRQIDWRNEPTFVLKQLLERLPNSNNRSQSDDRTIMLIRHH